MRTAYKMSSVPLQQTLRYQHTAFANFFAGRARYPRFKSRNSRQCAHYTRSAFRMRDGELRMAKTSAPLAFVWSFDDVDLASLNWAPGTGGAPPAAPGTTGTTTRPRTSLRLVEP